MKKKRGKEKNTVIKNKKAGSFEKASTSVFYLLEFVRTHNIFFLKSNQDKSSCQSINQTYFHIKE